MYPIPDVDAKKQYGEIHVFEVHFDTQEKKKKVIVLSAPSEDEKKVEQTQNQLTFTDVV